MFYFIHPSAEIRAKYVNPSKGERLYECLVVKKGKKVINQKEQAVIFFHHDEFPNIELHAITWYISVVEEGTWTDYLNDEEIDEDVEGKNDTKEELEVEENTYIY